MTDLINKVICGDCLEVMRGMPDKSVDCVITDPPYGIGSSVSGTIASSRKHKSDYTMFDDTPEYVKDICVPAIIECLRIAKRVVITPGKYLSYYPQPDSFGVFYQPATTSMQLWGRLDAQPIFYYGRPYDIGKTIKSRSYTLIEKPSSNEHPCAKPIKAWKKLLSDVTQEGDLILDPFLGSGTTAVAAKLLNRRYIGIEIEPKYCEVAERRLAQQTLGI